MLWGQEKYWCRRGGKPNCDRQKGGKSRFSFVPDVLGKPIEVEEKKKKQNTHKKFEGTRGQGNQATDRSEEENDSDEGKIAFAKEIESSASEKRWDPSFLAGREV